MKSRFDIIFEEAMDLLTESRKDDYEKRLEIAQFTNSEEIADMLVSWNDPKKEKCALKFIINGELDLESEDLLKKFYKAYEILNRQHLDYQKFYSLDEILERTDATSKKISNKLDYDPSKEPAFSNPYDAGDGVTIYQVEDSKTGMIAVRKAVDLCIGFDSSCWCLIARDMLIDNDEAINLTSKQREDIGLYDPSMLSVAWYHWTHNSAYPKRIAFKNGKPLAFCANKSRAIKWWDIHDDPFFYIPHSTAVDDPHFTKSLEYNALWLAKNSEDAELLRKLYVEEKKLYDSDDDIISAMPSLASNENLPDDIIADIRKNYPSLSRFIGR